MWQSVSFRRRTDPKSQVYSYRAAPFKYRCYMVCGTTAGLHRQASTVVLQMVLKNNIVTVVVSESVVVLNEVVTMCVAARRALFNSHLTPVEWPTSKVK